LAGGGGRRGGGAISNLELQISNKGQIAKGKEAKAVGSGQRCAGIELKRAGGGEIDVPVGCPNNPW